MFEKSVDPLKSKLLDGIVLETNGRFRYLSPEKWDLISASFELGVKTIEGLNQQLNKN